MASEERPRARFIILKSLACVQVWEHIPQRLKSIPPLVSNTMVEDTYTTTSSKESLIRMFLDGTAGEVYHQGRLATVERENDIALVAYGEHILATIDGFDVTFYTGHYGKHSQTVTGYVSDVGSLLNDTEERNVTVVEGRTPSMGVGSRVSAAGQYISEYVGPFYRGRDFSAVEKNSVSEVNNALVSRMGEIFG
jgi:hypothetical protein